MTTISSLMSTVCALGVSIGVLLPVESVLIPSSSGLGYLRVATHLEAQRSRPFLNIACLLRLHPARLVRGHQETSCWPPSMSYVAPVSAVLLMI